MRRYSPMDEFDDEDGEWEIVPIRPDRDLLDSRKLGAGRRGIEALLLTPEDAAAVLGVGRVTVYELIRLRVLPSVKIGRCRRVAMKSLREYVDRLLAAEAS
jgi:excisionase family DNA binding protein